jgi:RES domain-containing protein
MGMSPFRGTVYRVAEPDQADLALTTDRSRDTPGRFNTGDIGAVYAALDAETAMREEKRSSEGSDAERCVLFTIELNVSHVIDLNDPNERAAWTLDEDDLRRDDASACQAIVEGVIATGAEAIRWPSATGEGESIAIYFAHLRDDSLCEITSERTIDLRGETAA